MGMIMRKILTALFIGTLAAAVTISSADASQGCGRGWHRNGHGYCVRNHRRVVMAPPAYGPPPATRVQTIVPPAQTGVIPNPGNSVCPYGYHPTGQGKCAPN
jgi:hypothetical protein